MKITVSLDVDFPLLSEGLCVCVSAFLFTLFFSKLFFPLTIFLGTVLSPRVFSCTQSYTEFCGLISFPSLLSQDIHFSPPLFMRLH